MSPRGRLRPAKVHDPKRAPDRAEQGGVWMTAATAAEYLDFSNCKDPVDAFRRWAKRVNLVARGRRGDVPLYMRRDLDAAVTVVVHGERV
jgi:hypothetical protein